MNREQLKEANNLLFQLEKIEKLLNNKDPMIYSIQGEIFKNSELIKNTETIYVDLAVIETALLTYCEQLKNNLKALGIQG